MKKIRVGDACEILNGYAFKSEKYVASGIRVIRIANVQKGYVEDTDPAFYPEDYLGIDKYMLKEGDLLMSLTGNVGRVAILQKEMLPAALNQRVACLRIKNSGLSKGYLFHFLNSDYFENKCVHASKGVAQKNMSTEWLKEYEIPLYPKEEQTEIENILDKLSLIIIHRKEELNQLDNLIKARFVEMFGDIKHVDCKFEARKLGEVASIGSSHRVFTTEFVDSGVPFYRGTEISDLSKGVKPKCTYYISEEHYNRIASDNTKPKIGDLLMPSICNKGQVWMVDTDEPFYYKDGRVLCISPNRKIFNTRYLECFMKEKTQEEYAKLGSGSTFAEFKIFLLRDIDILVPSIELQNQFATFVEQVNKSKVEVKKALDEAQLLFDSLMQKYFG